MNLTPDSPEPLAWSPPPSGNSTPGWWTPGDDTPPRPSTPQSPCCVPFCSGTSDEPLIPCCANHKMHRSCLVCHVRYSQNPTCPQCRDTMLTEMRKAVCTTPERPPPPTEEETRQIFEQYGTMLEEGEIEEEIEEEAGEFWNLLVHSVSMQHILEANRRFRQDMHRRFVVPGNEDWALKGFWRTAQPYPSAL